MTILLDITNNFKDWLSCNWNSLGDFFLWLVQGIGYLFVLFASWIILAGLMIIIRKIFKKDNDSREIRGCLLFYLVIIGIPTIIGAFVGYFKHGEKQTYAFVNTSTSSSDSQPWSGNYIDKENINDVAWDDTVFICTSSSSKRFHSTLSCPGMQNCESGERALTREEAEKRGRSHCRRCYYDY